MRHNTCRPTNSSKRASACLKLILILWRTLSNFAPIFIPVFQGLSLLHEQLQMFVIQCTTTLPRVLYSHNLLMLSARARGVITVLSPCVCVCMCVPRYETFIRHFEHGNRLFAKFKKFSTHRFYLRRLCSRDTALFASFQHTAAIL